MCGDRGINSLFICSGTGERKIEGKKDYSLFKWLCCVFYYMELLISTRSE